MPPEDKRFDTRYEWDDDPLFTDPAVQPPTGLCFDTIELLFDKYFLSTGDPEIVPFYHFKMADPTCNLVGHFNFRVGDTHHVRRVAGHIGYYVFPEFRGHGFAYRSCRAVAPFVRKFYEQVIITAEINAAASIKTIEKLGAEYLGEIEVPPNDPAYLNGARRKRRYCWRP